MNDEQSEANGEAPIQYYSRVGRRTPRNESEIQSAPLAKLSTDDRALVIELQKLKEADLDRLHEFLDSIDIEPTFIAADGATCD